MIDFKFSLKARICLRAAPARLNLWHGAVRSGKTTCSLIAWLMYLHSAPKGELLMVGKTERTLKRNILDPLEQILGTAHTRHQRGWGELWLDGRRIYLAGANDERAEAKIRGMTLAGAYGDELTLWPESFFKMLLSRLSVSGARLYGTTNPAGPHHWLKTGYLDRAGRLDLAQYHFELADNPALDPAYVAALRREYVEGSLWYRRFILGRWVQAEGAVYDFFEEDSHVMRAEDMPGRPADTLDLACDYGTSNATSVGLYASWNPPSASGPRCVRLRGYYHSGKDSGRQKTDAEYADEITRWLGPDRPKVRQVVLDPSAASFKNELRRRGYRVRLADNDRLDGIRTVARMMKGGAFKIGPDPSNRQLIRDIAGYVWDPKAQARGEDAPLKGNDHTLDELRYYLHTLHGRGVVGVERLREAGGR